MIIKFLLTLDIIALILSIVIIKQKQRQRTIEENAILNDFNYLEYITLNDQIENYDRQIDGYTQLLKLLDCELKTETDNDKKAKILNRQLSTLEKLNKTIVKRQKLEY